MKYDLKDCHDAVLAIRLRSAHRSYMALMKRVETLKIDAPVTSHVALLQAADLIPYCRAINHELAHRGLEITFEGRRRLNIVPIRELIRG